MGINDRVGQLLKEFEEIEDWEKRYKLIIQKGKQLEALPEEQRIESNKVKGCQSQVWLHAEMQEGRIIFLADSDAAIVKGIISLLLQVYSNSTPDEILQTKPDFVDELGLRQHLSMNRSNGLSAMLKQISLYALGFKAKAGGFK